MQARKRPRATSGSPTSVRIRDKVDEAWDGSEADPYCLRHCYTLVHEAGAGILAFVAAPAVISLLVLGLISRHGTRLRRPARRAAWTLTILSCLICFTALLTSVGITMLPAAVLTVCAIVTAPP